jgi:hypothetical protein
VVADGLDVVVNERIDMFRRARRMVTFMVALFVGLML